jgi:formylglycine-generating enzyme required for sulfatase activity
MRTLFSVFGTAIVSLPALVVACSSDTDTSDTSSSSGVLGGTSGDPGSSGGPGEGSEPSGTDGKKNGLETDVDCGGPDRPKCADGKMCNTGDDCESGVCKGTCQAPTADDGVKNGDETDVDCGGSSGKQCEAGKSCKEHSDCLSDGCDFSKKCAIARSCTAEAGGATCGEGSVDDPNKKHESCCKTVEVPRPAAQGGPYFLDKYLITAGRMRAFIERTNGNPRAFVSTLPEGGFIGWRRAWDARVPSTLDEVHVALGPAGDPGSQRAGCDLHASKARTYWMDDATNAALGETGRHPPNSKEILDAKVLVCSPLFLFYALCAWDGGRLPSAAEVLYAWRSDENRTFPWGNQPNDATRSSDNEVHDFPPGFPLNWVNVPEPGRYPAGYGKWGHADLVGTVFHYTRDINSQNTQVANVNSGSWESAHTISPNTSQIATSRAYWAFGARCAREKAN